MPLGSQDERDRQRLFERDERVLDEQRQEDRDREKHPWLTQEIEAKEFES